MSRRRTTIVAGASLLTGLTLGATGLAAASSSTPSSGSTAAPTTPGRAGHFGRGGFRGGPGGGGPFDLVTATSGSSLSVDTPTGAKTVVLTPATTYRRGRATASSSDLAVNEVVLVRYVDPSATSLVARSVDILPAHLDGYVTAIGTGTLTVIDGSGFTRTVTTSSATTYRNAGTAATASAVKVGSFVRALGAVGSDHSTLDATSIEVGRPAGPGPGGMRMRGWGGPGQFGNRDGAPAAPAPGATTAPSTTPSA